MNRKVRVAALLSSDRDIRMQKRPDGKVLLVLMDPLAYGSMDAMALSDDYQWQGLGCVEGAPFIRHFPDDAMAFVLELEGE